MEPMTTICPTPPDTCEAAVGRLSAVRPRRRVTSTPPARTRTIDERVRRAVVAVWRLLPERCASTPSEQAMSTLSQSDRIGERR